MPTDDQILTCLRQTFGHQTFRPGQREIIRSVLEGRHTLAVMPTGSGKSLCYQLPAILLDGLTVVISPLLALMKDQVDELRRRGIPAASLTSTQREGEREAIEQALRMGRLKLLFVAPERFHSPSFRLLMNRVRPVMVVVDEAHCISEWGHAFRPDYERLGEIIEELRAPHLVALTATATADIRADILRSLKMQRPNVSVGGFDRPNIHLEIHRLTSEAEKRDSLVAAVREHRPAIVYTSTRRQALQLAECLARTGFRAEPYHGGQEPDVRSRIQERFLQGGVDVVVATNAFGLGVNKANVRLVLHTELPRSLEAYYQEIGRAGRDGQPAIGALFFAEKDLGLQYRLLDLSNPPTDTVIGLHRLLLRARGPTPVPLLARDLPVRAKKAHVLAALRYLEGQGLATRKYSTVPLVLKFAKGVSINGESAANRLARLARGARGTIDPEEAIHTLELSGRDELYALIESLEAQGVLGRRQASPEPTYVGVPGTAVTPEHLRRLRIHALRAQHRLWQMVSLIRQKTCRRAALLKTLGEAQPPQSCQACDVCTGHRLTAVRSRLPLETRRRASRVSPSALPATVVSSARDTSRSR